MRMMISVPLILAAAAALSFLPVQDCLAYGPGDSWYYDHYRRGGPGVEYDYGTAPSGTYDYGGPSAPQGNAQVTTDNTVRAYPGFNTNVRIRPRPSLIPDTGGIPMMMTGMTGTTGMMTTGGITMEGPGSSTARAGDTVRGAGGSSSAAAAGCPGAGS
mgnify:CR=1 FL=1